MRVRSGGDPVTVCGTPQTPEALRVNLSFINRRDMAGLITLDRA
jgi:hypothetical protein